MREIVVDTNILFSSLRAKSSKIRELLNREEYKFYTPNFLIVEIFKHKEKILWRTKGSEEDVYELLGLILHKITFVNEEVISIGNFIEAYRLCMDIDEKDTPFVALALDMEAELCTGDEELKRGLQKKGFDKFFSE